MGIGGKGIESVGAIRRKELEMYIKGQEALKAMVHETGLCTGCGACVNLCPYQATSKDRTIILDLCDRDSGRCYAFCPRTPTDLEALRRHLFDPEDLTPELGAVKGFYVARAADETTRRHAQHGGTVTALVTLALAEGIIDTAILAEGTLRGLPRGHSVSIPGDVAHNSSSKFIVAPVIEEFNRAAMTEAKSIGVVATPCQALALAKMRRKPFPKNDSNIGKLRLVIGLFCGWALAYQPLKELLQRKVGDAEVIGLDIPPSKYHTMEVATENGIMEISIDEVEPCIRESCHYCFDMTAEFSDVSVGSARLPEGWEVARGWNQVLVRTDMGRQLLELAKAKKILEFREVPEGNLDRLKQASMNKKAEAVRRLARLSGSTADLLYLDCKDPVLCALDSSV